MAHRKAQTSSRRTKPAVAAVEDVDLGEATSATLTAPHEDDPKIYSHGFSVRVRLPIDASSAPSILARLGWSPRSRAWGTSTRNSQTYARIRGSAWLTHRAPRSGSSPLKRRNAEWGTFLYSLALDFGPCGVFVDVQGVRRADIDRLVHDVLGAPSYAIEYYRRAERYVVLLPHEAHRLAAALGGVAANGASRVARKRWLLRDYRIPLTVRRRTPAVATLNIYRIARGATAAYRCELTLCGKRSDRGQFGEADVAKLDDALQTLLQTHDVTAVAKPARWEPITPWTSARARELAPLGAAAWRGRRPAALSNCHIDRDVTWVVSSRESGSFPAPARVSTHLPVSSASEHLSPLLDSLRRELLRLPGHLAEVILDPEVDPGASIESLINDSPTAVMALGLPSQLWVSVGGLVEEHPLTESTQRLVLVVDPSAVAAVSDAVSQFEWETGTSTPGPLVHPHPHPLRDPLADHVRAMASWLDPLLHDLRDHCERTGLQIVLVSTDARPEHGKGPLARAHFYRDGRVRSLLGDAGRYHCHVRYYVESDDHGHPLGIVLWKDEAEGIMGRRIS